MTKAQAINDIARDHLNIVDLETQNSDRHDFHEVSVWGVKSALEAAYAAGAASMLPKTATREMGICKYCRRTVSLGGANKAGNATCAACDAKDAMDGR